MSKLKTIVWASRIRTLPLALSTILTGNAMAYYLGAFDILIFLFTVITTVLLQIISNFSNDIGDSEKGADNEERIGPQRVIQSGQMTFNELKRILKITILLTLISGIALLYISKLLIWEKLLLLGVGIFAIWAADNYTKGRIAYGYKAFGDVFVFIFFGIVGVMGSLFVQFHYLNNAAFLPAIGLGLLATSVLHLNNLRDIVNDAKVGKITIATRLGYENSRIYFIILLLVGITFWCSYVFTQNSTSYCSYLYWLGFLPLVYILYRFFKIKELKDYDQLLKPTVLSIFLMSTLFFISQIL